MFHFINIAAHWDGTYDYPESPGAPSPATPQDDSGSAGDGLRSEEASRSPSSWWMLSMPDSNSISNSKAKSIHCAGQCRQ